jgi:hypothetical protein
MKANLDIRARLQDARVGETQAGADFWRRFRTRAAFLPRAERPRGVLSRHPFATGLGSALAGAAALLLILLAAYRAGGEAEATSVRSLTILKSYESVLILEDEQGRGTIVWVVES